MRIVFIGSVAFSRRTLNRLLEIKAEVIGVCTLKESPANADHSDLSDICAAHSIPWIYAPDINSDETLGWITDRHADVIFCFGWSRLLGQRLLNETSLGVVGFHPAALPANRGRHPLIWALVLGLQETASTFYFMNAEADAGDILSQRIVYIESADNATSLYEKVTRCALNQLDMFVPQLTARSFSTSGQDHRLANTWRKRGKADGRIDWRMSARSIHNLIRALAPPYVGAYFLYRNNEYTVWNAELVTDVPHNIEPGKIIAQENARPVVKCGEQGLRLLSVEPALDLPCGEYL